jgi:hypothetical protein
MLHIGSLEYNCLWGVRTFRFVSEHECCPVGVQSHPRNGDGEQTGDLPTPRLRGLFTTPSSTLPLCKIYCRRCSVSCGVHQVRLWELGWDTISLNRPRALRIHSGSTVLHIAQRGKVACNGSQSRGTNLESRWIVRYWYNCKKLCYNLSSAWA